MFNNCKSSQHCGLHEVKHWRRVENDPIFNLVCTHRSLGHATYDI